MTTALFSHVATAVTEQRRLQRTVRWTARASAVRFGTAVWTATVRSPARPQAQRLYAGFAAAHAAHFAAVARFAHVTGGRNLFPRGRSLTGVGGWPTILAAYGAFAALVVVGRTAVASPAPTHVWSAMAGRGAIGLIGAMFVGTYLGQTPRSRWSAAPAAVIGLGVAANLLAGRHSRTPPAHGLSLAAHSPRPQAGIPAAIPTRRR